MDEFAVGATFADHVIRGVAGRGGMGVVYRALHVPLKREVALKVLAAHISTDEEFRTRFRHEFEAAASIQHPNVIPIYHAGERDGLLYVTMRYVDGTDLARLIAVETRLDPIRAAVITGQVAAALDAASRAGFVHRDVKPANVLIEAPGASERALLTDFGLTKFLHSDTQVTAAGTLIGTFDYSAPEQLNEQPVDARTDVYALGCVLFQALTGRVPFPRDSLAATLFAHLESRPPSVTALVPEAPAALDEVVATALAKRPDDRYASAGDLARAALEAVDRPSLARGVQRLSAGERAPGWRFADTPLPRPRGIALPGALVVEGPFVGRDDALERLRERFARAIDGERQVALITGEPGIGKTRLATELSREAHAEGAIVLYGRCDLESLVPYQPFVTAVQHFIAQRETLTLPAELEPELAELARFVPALRRTGAREPIAEDGETRRYRLFEAVTRLLAYAAREAPIVLVLDDLHWADTSTALLLAHLLGDGEPARQFVLGTIRDADGHRSAELTDLVARLARDERFERVALSGLEDAETQALVSAHGQQVSESFVLRLQDSTDGNPFFIKETLRSVAEGGGPGVPDGVKELIGTRLARLGETANRLLTVASVIGREFDLEVLETLVDEPEERIISALEEASDAALIGEVEDAADRFVFSHALVRETLYERQSTTRRVRAHHRVARALEEVGRATPAEIAHQYFESRHLDREGKAVEFSVRAGDAATAAFAWEDAAEHYRHALERLGEGDDARRCALLLALGGAESRGGEPEAVATFGTAAALARSHGLASELAQAALGCTMGYAQAAAIDTEGIELLEAALELVSDDALAAQLQARLANVLHFAGQGKLVETLSARALELARRSGDPIALVSALEARQTALVQSADLEQRVALARELLDLAATLGDRELKAMALHWHIYHLLEAGSVDDARRESRVLAHLAEELRQPTYLHFAVRWETMWALLADRPEEVQALIIRTYEIGKRAQAPEIDIEAAGRQLAVAWRHDGLGQFAELLEAQERENPQLGTNLPVMALAFAQAGDLDAARGVLARIDIDALARDMLWMAGMCILSQVCVLVGDVTRARVMYALLLPHRKRNVMVGMASCMGSAERFLGLLATLLGDYPSAEVHFDTAITRNAEGGLDAYFTTVRADYAAMLEARSGPADALRAAQLRAETPESTGEATQIAPPAPTQRA